MKKNVKDNKYSTLTIQDVRNLHKLILDTLAKRQELWKQEELRFREELRVKYGADAQDILLFLDKSKDFFTESVTVDSIEAIQNLQSKYDNYVSKDTPKGNADYQILLKLAARLDGHKIPLVIPIAQVTTTYNDVENSSASQKSNLAEEAKRQNQNEKLRVDYAEKAKVLNEFLLDLKKKVEAVTKNTSDLKASLKALQEHLKSQEQNKPKLDAAEAVAKEYADAHIIENKHTTLNIATLGGLFEQIRNTIQRNIQLLEKEIKMQEMTGISEELMAEFKDLFTHFDKEKTGGLKKNEFKACVQSLGEQMSKQDIDTLFTTADTDRNGTLDFNEFVGFMGQRMTDTDSQEEVLNAFKLLSGKRDYVVVDHFTDVVKSELIGYLSETMPKKEKSTIVVAPGDIPPTNPFDYQKWTVDVFLR